jgi:hypothetical protein
MHLQSHSEIYTALRTSAQWFMRPHLWKDESADSVYGVRVYNVRCERIAVVASVRPYPFYSAPPSPPPHGDGSLDHVSTGGGGAAPGVAIILSPKHQAPCAMLSCHRELTCITVIEVRAPSASQ